MRWGGKRLGAGNKKGSKHKKTLEQEALRELFQKKVQQKWEALIDAQLDESLKEFKARHYTIDQMIGRPKERIETEHTGSFSLTDLLEAAKEQDGI